MPSHPRRRLTGLIDKLQHAGLQEATDNLDRCGCGGLLHERPRPAEVGPYDVEPGPCDLGDLRWFNINDFVSGFSEPAGSSVNTGAHVRINPFTQWISDHGNLDRFCDGRPLQRCRYPAWISGIVPAQDG